MDKQGYITVLLSEKFYAKVSLYESNGIAKLSIDALLEMLFCNIGHYPSIMT